MKLDLKTIIIIIFAILACIATFKITSYFKDRHIEDTEAKYHAQLLRNDSLVKIKDGLYEKHVADSLTQRDLNRLIDSLKIPVKGTVKQITRLAFQPKTQDTKIDSIKVENDSIHFEDFYPQKKDYFTKYEGKLNTATKSGKGKFSFSPQNINLVITQEADKSYKVTAGVPEYFNITGLDVQSLPIKEPEINNWGTLLGGGLGKDFKDNSWYLKVGGGIRYKKVILQLSGATNKTVDVSTLIEF